MSTTTPAASVCSADNGDACPPGTPGCHPNCAHKPSAWEPRIRSELARLGYQIDEWAEVPRHSIATLALSYAHVAEQEREQAIDARRKLRKARRQRDKARALVIELDETIANMGAQLAHAKTQLGDSLSWDANADFQRVRGELADMERRAAGWRSACDNMGADLHREATAQQALADAVAKIADDCAADWVVYPGEGWPTVVGCLRAALAANTPPDTEDHDEDRRVLLHVIQEERADADRRFYEIERLRDGIQSFVDLLPNHREVAPEAEAHLRSLLAEGSARPPQSPQPDVAPDTGQDTTTPDNAPQGDSEAARSLLEWRDLARYWRQLLTEAEADRQALQARITKTAEHLTSQANGSAMSPVAAAYRDAATQVHALGSQT